MSEMVEIRRALQDIRDSQIATATDVKWIKDQAQDHGKELGKLKSRVDRQHGQSSVLGAVFGSLFAGAIAYFTRAHT